MLDPATDGKLPLQELIAGSIGGDVLIQSVTALSGGASSATYRVQALCDGEPVNWIFQRTAGEGDGGLARSVQAEVMQRAGRLGVPVPRVVARTTASDGLGDGVVTEMVGGEALAPRWLRQPEYELARSRLTAQCADALAKLHSAPMETWADLPLKSGSGADLLEGMFGYYREIGVDVPAYDLAFAWLKPRMPREAASCLVHGDFRSGNILVNESGLSAVLDWELCHLSAPAEDLGWLCAQAWRFGRWQMPVGGFGTREELLAAYGGGVTPEELHIWEVYGNLKWGMSCLQLAEDHVSGRVPSVERAAIGRRVSEVAADLTYLISFGEL